MIKKFLLLAFVLIGFIQVFGQIPAGYYTPADGKKGAELKTVLYNIIKGHTDVSYGGLYNVYQTSDKKPNGKVWDMYSDVPSGTPAYEFSYGSGTCGNYSKEGDCYNREHSLPQSWFAEASPMVSDAFHIYPTDGYVNGKRSNYPFGEVASPTWTSSNGSKLGACSFSGYTGTVFEPINEYKGDFARTYFYMAARYENLIASWTGNGNAGEVLDGTAFPAYKTWVVSLLLKWSAQDPVSQKEIDRNNAIYAYQKNRNPFIDHPEYAALVWGNGTITPVFTSTPILNVVEDQVYTYTIKATSSTPANLTIRSANTPAWLTFTDLGNGNATLTGTPKLENVGTYPISLTVSDGATTTKQEFQLSVAAKPTGIAFTSTPVNTGKEGKPYTYTITATDYNNTSGKLSITCSQKPTWLSFTDQQNNTATLMGTPAKADIGKHAVVLAITNGTLTAEQKFTVDVSAADISANIIETFENMPAASSSYGSVTFLGVGGITWSGTLCRTDETISQRAICMKHAAGAKIESGTITGGCGSLSFSHQQKYSGSGGIVTLYVNNTQIGQPVNVGTEVGTAVFSNINVSGDFTIKLESNGVARVAIDNLGWTSYTTNSFEEINKYSVVGFYPNPFSSELYMGYEVSGNENLRMEIYNQSGQMLKKYDKLENTPGYHELNLSDCDCVKSTKGMLIFKIITDRKVIVKKVFRM
jgi:endonuclease I